MKKYAMVTNGGQLLSSGTDKSKVIDDGIEYMKSNNIKVCILQTIISKEEVYTDWIIL